MLNLQLIGFHEGLKRGVPLSKSGTKILPFFLIGVILLRN